MLSVDIYILVEFADVIPEPTFREIVCDNTQCLLACLSTKLVGVIICSLNVFPS